MSDELTVESCLDELRNMFGHNQAVTISRFERWSTVAPHHLNWNVSIGAQRVSGDDITRRVRRGPARFQTVSS